jgi:hypothetical protein
MQEMYVPKQRIIFVDLTYKRFPLGIEEYLYFHSHSQF